jgi:guanine deaminase
MKAGEIFRASLAHTPSNPFENDAALISYEDGGLWVRNGRIAAMGPFDNLRLLAPDAEVMDWRGGFILPGFVDTHVHFPQHHIIGALGYSLLDWLDRVALPEEARMANDGYALETAQRFVSALARHGTTTALVFGSHFAGATAHLFEAAASSGLRIVSGLVVSDRRLRAELHRSPEQAYRESADLIGRFHRQGRLLYAVTPRFALSASEAMLEVCQTLRREHDGLRFQTHLNENPQEISEVTSLFPSASDYLSVYERYDFGGAGAVMAHSVWTTDNELARMAAAHTSVAHCPCSNGALGSGAFPLRRHLAAGVNVALGTDVGAGTGYGLPKEALQAYLVQRGLSDGVMLGPGHLLYLSTLAGARAAALDDEVGDFTPGKAADFVYVRPPAGSELDDRLHRAENLHDSLAAIFALAGAESIREVRIEGQRVARPESQGREC